jgi:hypothetical protein
VERLGTALRGVIQNGYAAWEQLSAACVLREIEDFPQVTFRAGLNAPNLYHSFIAL